MTVQLSKSASTAHRWLKCSGSPYLISKVPRKKETDAAAYLTEGKAAHFFAARALQEDLDLWELVNEKYVSNPAEDDLDCIFLTAEMADHVQVYLDIVRKDVAAGGRLVVEHELCNSSIAGGRRNIADAIVFFPDTAIITDLKYGAGLIIDPCEDEQVRIYALTVVLNDVYINHVTGRIVQPRTPNSIREVTWTREELFTWYEDVYKPGEAKVDADNVELVLGGHCRFCPAMRDALSVLSEIEAVDEATSAELAQLAALVAPAEMAIRAINEALFKRLSNGETIEGWKLVAKRATRVWKNGATEALLAILNPDDCYEQPSFKTPAALEKTGPVAKALIAQWVYTPDTGLTVASASDKRIGIVPRTAAEKFAHVERT